MKYILLFPILLLLALTSSCVQSTPSASGDEESIEAVRERVEVFSNAFVEADTLALSALLTDNYIHTNTDGSLLNKQRWLAWIQTQHHALRDGTLQIDSYTNESVTVALHGTEAAVVTGINISNGVRNGEAFQSHIRFTHLWVREDSQWRRAAFHDTRLNQ